MAVAAHLYTLQVTPTSPCFGRMIRKQLHTPACLSRLLSRGHQCHLLCARACATFSLTPRLGTAQGRADLAMAILLRLGRPDILSYIVEHGLFQVLIAACSPAAQAAGVVP